MLDSPSDLLIRSTRARSMSLGLTLGADETRTSRSTVGLSTRVPVTSSAVRPTHGPYPDAQAARSPTPRAITPAPSATIVAKVVRDPARHADPGRGK